VISAPVSTLLSISIKKYLYPEMSEVVSVRGKLKFVRVKVLKTQVDMPLNRLISETSVCVH